MGTFLFYHKYTALLCKLRTNAAHQAAQYPPCCYGLTQRTEGSLHSRAGLTAAAATSDSAWPADLAAILPLLSLTVAILPSRSVNYTKLTQKLPTNPYFKIYKRYITTPPLKTHIMQPMLKKSHCNQATKSRTRFTSNYQEISMADVLWNASANISWTVLKPSFCYRIPTIGLLC